MNNREVYKESLALKVINFITIACAISYRMTILPDLLFRTLMSSRFSICIFIILELIALFINKQCGLKIQWRVVKYPPLTYLLILSVIQVIIAIVNLQIESTGAALFTIVNDFLLCVLVYSLLCARKAVIPREYMTFAYFNIVVTVIAVFLTLTGIMAPYTNEINGLSTLFQGNVESGQTYYMPHYIAVQSSNIRVALTSASYFGWSFEPHVFCLFVIPAIFFSIAVSNKNAGSQFFFYVLIGLFVVLESFSVTSFLAIVGCLLLYLLVNYNKRGRLFVGVFVVLVTAVVLLWMNKNNIDLSFLDYTRSKLIDDTGSADYSANKLESLFIPDSFLGDGLFGWDIRHTKKPNIGILSWPFVIAYFITFLIHEIKAMRIKERVCSMASLGVLYAVFHMLKLSQSAFCMPFLFLMLAVLCRVEDISRYKGVAIGRVKEDRLPS